MILKGSSRGGDAALAVHLLNTNDNDHIEVHSVSGFMTDDVAGAFQEMRAISKATACKQFMFSLSLSPPQDVSVSNEVFEVAISDAMKRLGLSGQPHVVIFHEKHGRRHAHLVVSRIDAHSMKAINLPFFKEKLCNLSRELFIQHGWELPKGHLDRVLSDPLNYSLEEKQVADRAERDPKALKTLLIACWQQSDSIAGFEAALLENGFHLCRGDRRGFVAVDGDGNIYSLSRWLGVKSKDLKARLGEPELLRSIDEVLQAEFEQADAEQADAEQEQPDNNQQENAALLASLTQQIEALEAYKQERVCLHRQTRARMRERQQGEATSEKKRFQQSKSWILRVWQWAAGKRYGILKDREAVLQRLKQAFEAERHALGERQRAEIRQLRAQLAELKRQLDALTTPQRKPKQERSQRSEFQQKADPDFAIHKAQIEQSPTHILRLVSHMRDEFSLQDIRAELSRFIENEKRLNDALAEVLASSELLELSNSSSSVSPKFTTHRYQRQHTQLMRDAAKLAEQQNYTVRKHHEIRAIRAQNKQLHKKTDAQLSQEQRSAIAHLLKSNDLSCVVGLAGAGKSTLLAAAKDAWEAQGYRVIGGALAGKAADGLQTASNIPSRTLHSWEYGWKHGTNELNAGDVFVIDEAGMVGTAQLARIVETVCESGAKLVLIGDPEQLQPIEAGTPFKDITQRVSYAELAEIRRQKADWQKAASLDLARGRTGSAIKAYNDKGMVERASSLHDAINALVEDYMVDFELHGDEKSRLALAHRREDVFDINQGIRAARKSAGELRSGVTIKTDHGKREFAVGDRVLFARNDHQLGVKNGMLGTVVKTGQNNLKIELDRDDGSSLFTTIKVNIDQYKSLDHGYATTIHKSQGVTVDHTFLLKSRSMGKHLQYVAMTRHTENLTISMPEPEREIQKVKDYKIHGHEREFN